MAIKTAHVARDARRSACIPAEKNWKNPLLGKGCLLTTGDLISVGLPVSGHRTPLYLEAVRPIERPELFRQELTHHLRPHNECPQPMAYREEPFRLLRRHPLAGRVFLTESYL